MLTIRKIISGGQTGVDRAALDAGLQLGIPIGGACPKGRKAEDGIIDPKYPLQETSTSDYPERTRKNVQDADGTLILFYDHLSGGSALTKQLAEEQNKPVLALDLQQNPSLGTVTDWINKHKIKTLNVAGPRESTHPGIYQTAYYFLLKALRVCC